MLAEYLNNSRIRTSSGRAIDPYEIFRRTGIETRHMLQALEDRPLRRAEVIPQMAFESVQEALAAKNWDKVDYLFGITSFPYRESLSCRLRTMIEERLQIQVISDGPDIHAECASFIWLLDLIQKNRGTYSGKNILVVASEYLSPIASGINRSLLSDASSALAFTLDEDMTILGSSAKHFPEFSHLIRASARLEYCPETPLFFFPFDEPHNKVDNGEEGLNFYLGEIDGPAVFEWALDPNNIIARVTESLEDAGLDPAQLKLVVPHQANGRIINGLADRLPRFSVRAEVFSNIAYSGNSGAVAILKALGQARGEGKILWLKLFRLMFFLRP